MTLRTASCSCGKLTVTTTADPVRISVCHCLACQRRTGSVYGAQARFRREHVTIEGSSQCFVRVADSGNKISFYFCPTCGSTVHWCIETHEHLVVVAMGAFADPSFPVPRFSVFETHRHSWVGLPDGLERSP